MSNDAAVTKKVIQDWWENLPKNIKDKSTKRFYPKYKDCNIVFNQMSFKQKLWFYEQMQRNYFDDFKQNNKGD